MRIRPSLETVKTEILNLPDMRAAQVEADLAELRGYHRAAIKALEAYLWAINNFALNAYIDEWTVRERRSFARAARGLVSALEKVRIP